MNHSKRKTILIFGFLFGVVFSCYAQKIEKYKKRTPEEKARYFTKIMVDSINVTEVQEEALYQMNLILGSKFDFVNDSIEAKNRKTAYQKIYQFRDSCMKSILPIKEFLRFQDFEREKYDRKKQKETDRMKKED